MRKITCINLLLILIFNSYLYSQNPPDVKWQQIKTRHFRVVFPEEIQNNAMRIANKLEYIYHPDSKTLNTDPDLLNIYLYNRKVMSNGFFTLAPRRSVFYNVSPQNHNFIGCGNWYNMLSVHEFRHCNQFAAAKQNFTKVASWFYGDYGQFLPWLSVPYWFFEGDAVLTETTLTDFGRGRIPHFEMHLRSLLIEDIDFSYQNAKLLSYKNYYPGPYSLGYFMTTYIRRNHGPKAINKTITRSSWLPFYPYSFSNSLRKYTGYNSGQTFKRTMNELDSLWERGQAKRDIKTPDEIPNPGKKVWTNYSHPYPAKKGGVIAVKSGLESAGSVVLLKNKKEKKLFDINTDCLFPDGKYMHSNGEQIVWASTRNHKRWTEVSYSEIWLYDINTGELRKITQKSRFQSPAINPGGNEIVAVETTPNNEYYLVIIGISKGKVISRTKVFNNHIIRRPDWSPSGDRIVLAHNNGKGEGLALYDLKTKQLQRVIDCSTENIGEPTFSDENSILYQSSYSGVDNIYKIEIETGQIEKITSAQFGALHPGYDTWNKTLFYSNYTPKGYNICSSLINDSLSAEKEEIIPEPTDYFEPVIEQEQGHNIFADEIPKNNYPIKSYNPLRNLFNVHSWGIYAEGTQLVGKIISDNHLQTMHTEAGIGYNPNEDRPFALLRSYFRYYYPVLFLEGRYGGRNISGITDNEWRETRLIGGVSFPLDFSERVWNTNINLGIQAEYLHIEEIYEGYIPDANYYPFSGFVEFQRFFHQAPRDFAPRFGQYFRLSLDFTPFNVGGDNYLSTSAGIYLPGILAHHSLQLGVNFEKRSIDKYIFEGDQYFVRGYDYHIFDNFTSLTSTYKFPLLYPDWNLLSLFYLKRIRGGIFYDHGIGITSDDAQLFRSIGGELTFDINLFNLPYEISTSLQFAKCLDKKQSRININLLDVRF
ncbi:MAG: hypothetical protein K9M80_06070 [Candidatus Marinimicrobia bacterium]|nr:hypothetical protein [Candidatus Neomarinimicrobiota bacterium]